MLSAGEFFVSLVLPAIVSGAVLIAGWRGTRHWRSARDSRSWSGPVATAGGFACGYLALFGWPEVPPPEASGWLLVLAIPLAGLGLLEAYARFPPPTGTLAIAFGCAGSLLLLSWPLLSGSAGDGLTWMLLAVTALAVVVLIPLDLLAQRLSLGRLSAVLLAVAAPAALTLGCSGSTRLGLIGAVLAGTQAGGVAAGVVLGRAAQARGVVVVCGTLLAGLLWTGYAYAELSAVDGLLLAAAPNFAWLGRWAPRRYGWLVNLLTQVGLVLVVALIAVFHAWAVSASAAPGS